MTLPNDLRAASDALLRDLEALAALEDEKRTLPLDDPRLVELAERIEAIAVRVLAGSERQTSLAKAAVVTQPDAPSIEAVVRPLPAILAEWREVERRAAAVEEGSAEAAELQVITTRLRAEYAEAHRRRTEPAPGS